MEVESDATAGFQGNARFVVLMLENRSFDHLLGYLKATNPKVMGLTGSESNQEDPNSPGDPPIKVGRASSFVMTFDPGHEFYDVQIQLYGPQKPTDPKLPPVANPPCDPAPMTGFVASATKAIEFSGDETLVMECFQPDQLPVLTTLAREFALFNFWYSSLPGPTWPNRFFIHAATSGGLTDSPSTAQIVEGFAFQNGTIYERLKDAGRQWRIYHDGLPQTAGISSLRLEYVDPLTKRFQAMEHFFDDVKKGELPDYSFIEPRYDTGNNYFDEHGGFYDHQSPPATVPTGDDAKYANPVHHFPFERLGVRVPALVVSAYTGKATIIGDDPADPATVFDHTSVLATVEKRFGLTPLTNRDAGANTLEVALNLSAPRLLPTEALTQLPNPASVVVNTDELVAAGAQAPLSANQTTMAALALACEMQITPANYHAALISNHQKIVQQKDAADYIQKVETEIDSRRQAAAGK